MPNLPTLTKSAPLWLQLMRDASRRPANERNGRLTLPPALIPNPQQREIIETELSSLRAKPIPGPDDERQRAVVVTKLLEAFRGVQVDPEGYFDALADLPGWACDEARVRWLQGLAQGLDFPPNFAFPPSPPQLAIVARACMRPVYEEIAALTRILAAEPSEPSEPAGPPPAASPEAIARRAIVVEEAKRSLQPLPKDEPRFKAIMPPVVPETFEQMQERYRQQAVVEVSPELLTLIGAPR